MSRSIILSCWSRFLIYLEAELESTQLNDGRRDTIFQANRNASGLAGIIPRSLGYTTDVLLTQSGIPCYGDD
jgi:hypothetical protein